MPAAARAASLISKVLLLISFPRRRHFMRSTRRHAFTLVELLVVIGIIAVLVSILLPSLNRARQTAIATKCLNNVKQLTMANQMYLNEYKGKLPFTNWDGGVGPPPKNAHMGWLYDCPIANPVNDPTKVNTGAYWPYLKNYDIYHCPSHNKNEAGQFGQHNTDTLTSYLMNGAVNAYGAGNGSGGIYMSTITQYKPDDVIIWEADERGGSAWNDGASYPSETFDIGPDGKLNGGLTARHGKTAVVACFDGHAEWMSHKEFYDLAIGQFSGFRNRIWCAPNPPSSNGH
jgi:prepilin-type N-terminal cleavage/methylation domain-containing protein